MSTPAIAARLGLPLSTVDMHMRNGIRLLWRLQVNPQARALLRVRRQRRTYKYERAPNRHVTDEQIIAALAAANGNKTHAAQALGWNRQGINRRLRQRQRSCDT